MSDAKGLYEDSFFKETWITMAVVFVASVVASFLGGAAPALALAWIPLGFYYAVRAPLHIGLRMFLVLSLFIEPPEMMPGAGYWVTPLEAANNTFYGSLKMLTGLPGLYFSLFLLIAFIFCVRARKAAKPETKMPAARLARRTLAVTWFAVIGFEVYGILRGGKLEPSFIQVLPLFTMPVVGYAFLMGLRGRDDLYALANIIVSVAMARSVLVAWVFFIICLPQGFRPEYATTHGDSVTFAAAFLILLANVIEIRNRRTFWRFAIVGGGLLMAMVMNNRRLAFASIAVGAIAMYVTLPQSKTRQKVNRYLRIIIPIAGLYFFIGEGIDHPLFAPARLAWSAFAQKDESSNSRVVENENLMATLNDFPLLGQGFGHEYKELEKHGDISEFMPLYKYVPHNSVLWLWTVGGLVGFALLWMGYVVAAYLAARAYRFAENPVERASTLACVGMVAICISNDWGDVGAQSNLRIVMFAVAFAVGARVCADAELRARAMG